MTKNENNIPGFRNYDKWMEGYSKFSEYLSDGFNYIKHGEKASKYHSANETPEETREKLISLAMALIKGAIAVQYISEKDFYYTDNNIEILIRFKNQDYKDIPYAKRTNILLQHIINLLKTEKKQFIRIATAYDRTD